MKWYLKTLLFASVALLLFPATIQTAHIFSGHEHTYCNHYSDSHFHSKTLDCDISHFNQHSFLEAEIANFEIYSPLEEASITNSFYCFLSDFRLDVRSLRGPPSQLI